MLCGYTVPPPGHSRNTENLEHNHDENWQIPELKRNRDEGVAERFFLHLMSIIIPGRIGCVCKFLLTGSHQIKWETLTPPEQVWPGSQGDSLRDWRVFAHWVES